MDINPPLLVAERRIQPRLVTAILVPLSGWIFSSKCQVLLFVDGKPIQHIGQNIVEKINWNKLSPEEKHWFDHVHVALNRTLQPNESVAKVFLKPGEMGPLATDSDAMNDYD